MEMYFLTRAMAFFVGWSWITLCRDVSTLVAYHNSESPFRNYVGQVGYTYISYTIYYIHSVYIYTMSAYMYTSCIDLSTRVNLITMLRHRSATM